MYQNGADAYLLIWMIPDLAIFKSTPPPIKYRTILGFLNNFFLIQWKEFKN